MSHIDDILRFWFEETTPKQHFTKDPEFDALISRRFEPLYQQIVKDGPGTLTDTPKGALAIIILLDQFSRNMFRDQPQAFAADGLALSIAQQAIANGFDLELKPGQRTFIYMPYMHSEDREVQKESIRLFEALGNPQNLDYAHRHKDIIDRFGRYPHRNAVLGRDNTEEEEEFLKEHSGF